MHPHVGNIYFNISLGRRIKKSQRFVKCTLDAFEPPLTITSSKSDLILFNFNAKFEIGPKIQFSIVSK